ncbi:MAG TPA: YncE family protein, partial [Candidatus Nitrosocosmicus sp.]
MVINKENKAHKINGFNLRFIIILSTFTILLLYLSNIFLFNGIKQVSADSVISIIPVGHFPQGVAYDSAAGRVYVTNAASNTLSVISTSTNKVIVTIPVGSNPYGVAYDSAAGRVYVVNGGSNTLSVISTSTNKVIVTIPVGH